RRSKVKRRRQPHPADRSVPHSLTEYGNVQPRLQRQQLLGANPPQKTEVRRAAAKRHVLAVVEPEAVALERERRAAEARARLVECHLDAGVRQLDRRGEPGEATPDDGRLHPLTPASERASTRPFSHRRSETRPFRTSEGSSAIRSSKTRYLPAMASTAAVDRRSSSGTSSSPRSSHSSPRCASKATTSSTGPSSARLTPKRSRSSRGR